MKVCDKAVPLNVTEPAMARRLKAAGLRWVPQKGDWYLDNGDVECVLRRASDFIKRAGGYSAPLETLVWLPTLGQLHEMLESLGYLVDSIQDISGYCATLYRYNDKGEKETLYRGPVQRNRVGSLGLAMLWILERIACGQVA